MTQLIEDGAATRRYPAGRTPQPTVHARMASLCVDRAVARGYPRAELLRVMGLREEELREPGSRVLVTAIARFWKAAAAHFPDPLFGLRLGAERPRGHGLVYYTMLFSDSLDEALGQLVRYGRIVSDTLEVTVETAGENGSKWIRIDVHPALRAFRPAADFRLAMLLTICQEISGGPLTPLAVRFPYSRPDDVSEYERFFRARLEFEAPATALLLGESDLARPVVRGDTDLVAYLDRLAEQILAELPILESFGDRVGRMLWSRLSAGIPSLERVGRALGMCGRTLQRRLVEEGTTFSKVLEALRKEMAPHLLRDGRLAVSEVASLLGYTDPGSFRRAFRRWNGESPRAFRHPGVAGGQVSPDAGKLSSEPTDGGSARR